MPLVQYEQHPNEIVDYPCDWRLPGSVQVSSVTSTVSPAGPTVTGSAPSATRSQTRVANVTADVLYVIDEAVTFSNGEKRVERFEVLGKIN